MWVVSQKSFRAGGEEIVPGQLVNAGAWKNREVLLKGHWVRAATAQELRDAEDVEVEEEPKPAKTKKPARIRRQRTH